MPAFEAAPSEELGLELVKALKDSAGFRGLRADLIKPLLTKYPESVQKAGEPLVTSLNAGAVEQAAHLEKLLKELPPEICGVGMRCS